MFIKDAVNKAMDYIENLALKISKNELIPKQEQKKPEEIQHTRYDVNNEAGLTTDQVNERIKNKETNRVKNVTDKTYFQIIWNNLFTFYNMLMIAIAVVLWIVIGPEVILNLFFLVILLFNLIIGTAQECKAKTAIRKLKLLSSGKIAVRRNMETIEISPEDIVLDDILVLKAGDQIPVDCVIKSDDMIEVNESLLTGESHPIKKAHGDTLLAGSYIISGTCAALVNKVGLETYICSIESKAKSFKKPKSKLLKHINIIIKTLASIAIPLALIVFWNELMHDTTSFKNAVLYSGTTITYMIPAGLVLIVSLAMQTGVMKLSSKKTLANDLYSVEALSRIDTLCLDKTGTITDGTMTIDSIHTIDPDANIELIMPAYLKAFKTQNQTSKALLTKYDYDTAFKAIETIEFTSERKFSAVKLDNGHIYTLGAPEYLTSDKTVLETAQSFAKYGLRVVLLAQTSKLDEDHIRLKKNKPITLFMIRDNIRPEIKSTMEWFRENDVDIKVISGDNPDTVSYIAMQAGINGWDKCVDMSTVNHIDMEQIVLSNSVFGRTSPEQKAEIIDILKKNKKTVAAVGDGVNDIIFLKKADCSIALANGAPATKNISNIVLLDSNFSNMKTAVLEGRRIVNNIQRSASLFIMKDICWFFITLLPILFGTTHVIEPTVMTLVNIVLTGFASFLLALEPDSTRISGNFVKTVLGKAISSGFFLFLPILFVYIYSFVKCGLDPVAVASYISTNMIPVISLCVTISGLVIFFNLSQPFTHYRRILFFVSLGIILFFLTAIPEFFLINGTTYVNTLLTECDSIGDLISTIWNNQFSFNIYKSMPIDQILIVSIFLVISSILYYITDRIITRALNITMFSDKPLIKDED